MRKILSLSIIIAALFFSASLTAQEFKLRANIENYNWEEKTITFGQSYNPESQKRYENVNATFTDKIQIKLAGKTIKASEFNEYFDKIKKKASVIFEGEETEGGKFFVKRIYLDKK